jgi:SAM-dependent methyltransferase
MKRFQELLHEHRPVSTASIATNTTGNQKTAKETLVEYNNIQPMAARTSPYDFDAHIAELYDQREVQTEDIQLLSRLIGSDRNLTIFEPFCGTGRILIPLAQDGHQAVGLDLARTMLDRARAKIASLSPEVQARIQLIHGDALAGNWPCGFDLVLLGGNCFYELSSAQEQEACVASAAATLKPGGHLYVDNDHVEEEVPAAWLPSGPTPGVFPRGTCADGTSLKATNQTLSFDLEKRIWKAHRTITATSADGRVRTFEHIQRKHPVSFGEVKGWLEKHGLVIEQTTGDRTGHPYSHDSPRAIFWARKGINGKDTP